MFGDGAGLDDGAVLETGSECSVHKIKGNIIFIQIIIIISHNNLNDNMFTVSVHGLVTFCFILTQCIFPHHFCSIIISSYLKKIKKTSSNQKHILKSKFQMMETK